MILTGFGGYAFCPIADSLECRDGSEGKNRGDFNLWSKIDFQNFIKAFLRNKKLVDVFINPSFLSPKTEEEIEAFENWVR